MRVRLIHIDGKLPNLALMKLAGWHKGQGDEVHLSRLPSPSMFEPSYDTVYASSIFSWSARVLARAKAAWPDIIIGGTGTGKWNTVEEIIGTGSIPYDYSIYPNYPWSLGFTQRGCRLSCGFCVVPKKEGKPQSVSTISDIWRPASPKCVVLLDNDFFGQATDQWHARIRELIDGHFKVSFNQGVNIRMVTEESAEALASVRYYDDQFTVPRLYTAWDNLGDERRFFDGCALLERAGIPPCHLMVYMLIGYARGETMARIMYRYRKLKEAGCKPYPMVYNNIDPQLKRFQRWVVRRYDDKIPWDEFGRKYYERSPLQLGLEGTENISGT